MIRQYIRMSFVGEQLKKYRNIKGMTRQDIADAPGASAGGSLAQ